MKRAIVVLTAISAGMLASCGDNGDTAGPGATDATLSVGDGGDAGDILVDSAGRTLYLAEEEADGTVLCNASCADNWPPLTVADDESPTAGDGVDGALATVERDDGSTQVTYEGFPLYAFVGDDSPGQVTGDGISDVFDGVPLTWRVATPSGPSGEDNGGGYSY